MKSIGFKFITLLAALLPLVASCGQGSFSDTAINQNGQVTILSGALTAATAFSPYTADITASGGAGDYTWTLVSGVLPPGLSLLQGTPSAGLGGTPTISGTYAFRIKVTDQVGLHDSKDFTLAVNTVEASVGDVSIAEGDSGTRNLVVFIDLSAAVTQEASVDFDTVDGTALAGINYFPASGTAVFQPGTTSAIFDVAVIGNTTVEADKTFTIVLSNPVNMELSDASIGTATILNDDIPSVSIEDAFVVEGDTGDSPEMVFTVSLDIVSPDDVTVDYAIAAGGTAVSGTDFTFTAGTLTIPAGSLSADIDLPDYTPLTVIGDDTPETDETLFVRISSPDNATIDDDTATGTIINDDIPGLSIDDVTVTETDAGTVNAVFTVTMDAWTGDTVTVEYFTGGGTATAGADYTPANGILTFSSATDLTETVTILVLGETTVELTETFNVLLSNPTNATVTDATGVCTITDNDLPTVSIDDVTMLEGADGGATTTYTFTVTLSAATDMVITVDYETDDVTANDGTDFTGTTGPVQLTFPAQTTTQTIDIDVVNDTIAADGDAAFEATETFEIDLSSATPAGVTITDATGVGTILNDDYDYFAEGDFNGDGRMDIIVGEALADAGGANRGKAYVFLNNAAGTRFDADLDTSSADLIIQGAADNDRLGNRCFSIGNFNGDDKDDFAVVAPRADFMASADAGKLYVFFGEDSTDASGILQPAPQTITVGGAIGVGYLEVRTSAAGANLGLSSSSAGDFDADGIVDLVVGTARGDSAYLFLGDAAYPTGSPQTLDVSTADIIFNKETTGDFFGAAVARAGDFNKDGYGDVMFGAFKSNNGGTERGQAYIVFGRPITSSLDVDISLFANVVITTTTDRSWLGHSVGLVGDVNGDGFVDVGVGAPADKGNTDMDGFVYIFKGDSAYSVGTQQQFVTSDAHFIVDLNENDNECGNAFAGIGDITGDGFDDFAVGARNHLVGANLGEGEVLLFSGKAATDTYNATDASLIITGVADTDDFFGWCLSSGDVDGNGTVDLLIGVPFYDAGGTWRGGLMILKDTSITNATEINYNNALLPVPDFVTISGLEDNGVFGTFGEGQQD